MGGDLRETDKSMQGKGRLDYNCWRNSEMVEEE